MSDDLTVKYLTLESVDLSQATGRILTIESEFTDCLFDMARLGVQSLLGRRFWRCSFRDAKLPEVRLSGVFEECDFSGAALRGLQAMPNTTFVRCRFDRAQIGGAQFSDARFIDCTYDGMKTTWKTSFVRCQFVGGIPDVGDAEVRRATLDGQSLPDRWRGEGEAHRAWDRLVHRYLSAGEHGRDTLPLEPLD